MRKLLVLVFAFLTVSSPALFLLTSEAHAQVARRLVDVATSKNLLNKKLQNGVWTDVFQVSTAVSAGDVLVIRASNQVTTEDNLVIFSGRILANGAPIGVGAKTTGAQPDNTGGNHHLPVSALASIQIPVTSSNYSLKFQVRADIVSKKINSNVLNPVGQDTVSYGELLVERYSTSGSKGAIRASSTRLGASGRTPCCHQATYKSVLGLNVDSAPNDIIFANSQVVAWHNKENPAPNIFDGEQIASVITLGGAGVSGYLGENVTRTNPVVSLFNEAVIKHATFGANVGIFQGSNFKNGAYFENNGTRLNTMVFSSESGAYALKTYDTSSLASQQLSASEKTLWSGQTSPSQSGFVKVSALVNLAHVNGSAFCEVKLQYGSEMSKVHKFLSKNYPHAHGRLELYAQMNSSFKPKVTANCQSGNARILSGLVQASSFL